MVLCRQDGVWDSPCATDINKTPDLFAVVCTPLDLLRRLHHHGQAICCFLDSLLHYPLFRHLLQEAVMVQVKFLDVQM